MKIFFLIFYNRNFIDRNLNINNFFLEKIKFNKFFTENVFLVEILLKVEVFRRFFTPYTTIGGEGKMRLC